MLLQQAHYHLGHLLAQNSMFKVADIKEKIFCNIYSCALVKSIVLLRTNYSIEVQFRHSLCYFIGWRFLCCLDNDYWYFQLLFFPVSSGFYLCTWLTLSAHYKTYLKETHRKKICLSGYILRTIIPYEQPRWWRFCLPTWKDWLFTCISEINWCFPSTWIQSGLPGLQPSTKWFQVSVLQS